MNNEKTAGVIYAVTAYTLWGILPIYWKLIDSVFSMEILSNRIVWAFVFTAIIIAVTKQWDELKIIVKDKKQMLYIFIASILIAFNWGLYIWAVNSDKIVDASLGYYINPLLAVVLGVLIFKEKMNHWTAAALIIASVGVLIKTVQYGKIPWISLGLAISFGLYGAIKKSVKASSIVGLTIESAMVTPFAAAYIVSRHISGIGAFKTQGLLVILMLIGGGVVTAIPLLLFASGAKRLPLSLIGFTQYISPTISLFIGIFVYHEGFTAVDMIAFCFIWAAIAIYSFSQISLVKSPKNIEQIS
ncbi:EamA family transporter RarD [Clostridium saccharobutylicum]|nr:EamA family transporter RarD [Clostridium saccharobutylicum]MBC2403435.1 EamA family transporter RarD [Clostridium saccharobutylicum]MBC2414380.1 EamA family transporter RarD [Clostridium saccharobutylicum]MBC2436578.1 EamA family transporter RarD [Clostridium saccharobutylicum]MBC2441935.1 EamA family transporter RarD [Clostridium saccharobutylicum]MBC2446539.1 EamA family transporter RarD [Clostridium saccharobutylicum]